MTYAFLTFIPLLVTIRNIPDVFLQGKNTAGYWSYFGRAEILLFCPCWAPGKTRVKQQYFGEAKIWPKSGSCIKKKSALFYGIQSSFVYRHERACSPWNVGWHKPIFWLWWDPEWDSLLVYKNQGPYPTVLATRPLTQIQRMPPSGIRTSFEPWLGLPGLWVSYYTSWCDYPKQD